jgi:hypothetical protein
MTNPLMKIIHGEQKFIQHIEQQFNIKISDPKTLAAIYLDVQEDQIQTSNHLLDKDYSVSLLDISSTIYYIPTASQDILTKAETLIKVIPLDHIVDIDKYEEVKKQILMRFYKNLYLKKIKKT